MSNYYDELHDKAQSGDIEAQKELAYFYLEKRNRKSSTLKTKAFDLFRRAASKEDAEAQYLISFLYLNGIGRNKDIYIAQQWYEKSQQNGVSTAPKALKELFKDTPAHFPENDNDTGNSDNDHHNSHNDNIVNHPEGISFVDIAFKKDEDGKDIAQVIHKTEFTHYDNDSDDEPSQSEKRDEYRQNSERWSEDGDDSSPMQYYSDPSYNNYDSGMYGKDLVIHRPNDEDPYKKLEQLVGLKNVKSQIVKAKGGILFVDEAYVLTDNWGFGEEVVSTIMKAMEDDREDFIVIMAGYKDEMKMLLKSNPGIRSRFRHHFEFEDYSAQEMLDIFLLFANEQDYKVHKDAKAALLPLLKEAKRLEDQNLGNGRFVRNAFEKTIENMARRVMQLEKTKKRDLQLIMFADIPSLDDIAGDGKFNTSIRDNIAKL